MKQEVYDLVRQAYLLNVTDIHFQVQENEIIVLFRKNFKLVKQRSFTLSDYQKILRYFKFMTKLDISLKNKPQDGAYETKVNNERIFLRISTIPGVYAESLVIRLISANLQKLGKNIFYKPYYLQKITQQIIKNPGLYIFTGPTGSGKTVAMHALMSEINKQHKKIITIENPIEIINENYVQLQINENLKITFTEGLKSALRHDPDVIMIGEIRDQETAENVMRAALTGHTIMTTMHTKNKLGIIHRLLDFGFTKSEINTVLCGAFNQRLVKINQDFKIVIDLAFSSEINRMIYDQKESTNIQAILQKIPHETKIS